LNHIRAGMGIPDSAFSGNALKRVTPNRKKAGPSVIALLNPDLLFDRHQGAVVDP
jgi:hypothetical protein